MTAPAGEGSARAAADTLVAVVAGLAAAAWVGLGLAQAGVFRLWPVALAAAAVGLPLAAAGRRDVRASAEVGLVFALALAWIGKGYAPLLVGSDATVYLSSGIHVSRNGGLAADDAFLRNLDAYRQPRLFPIFGAPNGFESKSEDGLVYRPGSTLVYGAYPQITPVWFAIGHAIGGTAGAQFVSPVFGALALACLYALGWRHWGRAVAVGAVLVLATTLHELFHVRMPMGEAGGQCFLLAGMLAWSRWCDHPGAARALAAGLTLSVAALGRPEYFLWLPVAVAAAVATGWSLRALPRPALAVFVVAGLHALWLTVVVVPSHYPLAVRSQGLEALQTLAGLVRARPVATGLTTLAILAAIVRWRRRGAPALAGKVFAGLLATAFVAIWVALPGSPYQGVGWRFLDASMSIPTLIAALAGALWIARRARPDPVLWVFFLLGGLSLVCLAWDPRVHTGPYWGGRRLVPVVWPCLAFGLAFLLEALRRRTRALAAVVWVAVIAGNLYVAREIAAGGHYWEGAEEGIAQVATLIPHDAVAVLDPSLQVALLDIPLLYLHDAAVGQMRGFAGQAAMRPFDAYPWKTAPRQQLYLLQSPLAPPPVHLQVAFDPMGSVAFRFQRPWVYIGEHQATTSVLVDVYRVRNWWTPPWAAPLGTPSPAAAR